MSDINDQLNQPGNGDQGDEQPADTGGPEAAPPPGQALPGPHPHEAADIKQQAGIVSSWQDPTEGFTEPEQS